MIHCEPVDILVVEDNDSQRESIVLALLNSIPDVLVTAVADGNQALDFLFCRGAWVNRVRETPPRLILLDLALPGADGFFVLGQIRSSNPEEALSLTPVVMFTDSDAASSIRKCYNGGANSYIIKPLSFHDFKAIIEAVGRYWVSYNQVPV